MKRFSFKLEAVLSYRKLIEDGEEQKLKAIHTAVLEAKELIQDLQLDIDDHNRMLQKGGCGRIDMEKVRQMSAYLAKLFDDLIDASRLLSKLEENWKLQVEKLMEARRGREVVEKLKDKGTRLHEKESNALESKLHEELSVTQFGRLKKQELPVTDSDS